MGFARDRSGSARRDEASVGDRPGADHRQKTPARRRPGADRQRNTRTRERPGSDRRRKTPARRRRSVARRPRSLARNARSAAFRPIRFARKAPGLRARVRGLRFARFRACAQGWRVARKAFCLARKAFCFARKPWRLAFGVAAGLRASPGVGARSDLVDAWRSGLCAQALGACAQGSGACAQWFGACAQRGGSPQWHEWITVCGPRPYPGYDGKRNCVADVTPLFAADPQERCQGMILQSGGRQAAACRACFVWRRASPDRLDAPDQFISAADRSMA